MNPRTLQLVNGPHNGKSIRMKRPASYLRFKDGDYRLVRRGRRLFYQFIAPVLAGSLPIILLIHRAILEAL